MTAETLHCDHCDSEVDRHEATRTEPYADLDPTSWQSLCCPHCGRKIETAFVGRED